MNCENKYDMDDEDYENQLINSHGINATEIKMETLGSKDSKQTNETKKEQQGIARSQRLWNIVVSGKIDIITEMEQKTEEELSKRRMKIDTKEEENWKLQIHRI